MKIVIVSSWPPRHCGIATYSFELVSALRKLGHQVVVVCHTDGGMPDESDVYPVLAVGGDLKLVDAGWGDVLYDTVREICPEVVHIQHEYGLYTHNNDYSTGLLPTLFRWHVECDFPTLMTYHSVYTTLNRVERYFMDVSLGLISAGVVHEDYQAVYLAQNIGRVANNVYIIPHGAKEIKKFANAKKRFGLDGSKVVGMIGWWEPNKGFDRVVKLWSKIKKELGEDAWLVVAGDARPGSTSGQVYKPQLLEEISRSKARDSIKVIEGSFTPEEYDRVLSAFDLIVLPYSHASQSGNLAHAFALGLPAVVSNIEGLKSQIEESEAGVDVPIDDDEELVRVIVMIMKDDELRERYAKKAREYVTQEIKWSTVAGKHERLYEYRRERMRQDTEKDWEYRKVHIE